MDFTPTEAQQAVVDLASRIMDDHLDMDRHLAVETAGGWFDRNLWEDLASAGLLRIALGADVGGSGLDAVALALLLRAQGSHV
ncbi:MAG: acyl-CoA dehydrogenase family protein, partial [Myxococcota bacterium]|nr:acyl-CoA dehydrogenase family protein [Myxococcota bacterium]